MSVNAFIRILLDLVESADSATFTVGALLEMGDKFPPIKMKDEGLR